MKKQQGILARFFNGRLDRSILSDIGLLVGVIVFGYGLWQLSQPAAWLFAGASIVAASVLAVLPAKKPAVKAPRTDPNGQA